MNWFWQMLRIGSIALAMLAVLAGCTPKVAERGKFDMEKAAEQIVPNVTTQTEVMELLGSPSSKGQFGEKAWYYVAQRKEGVAFFAPEVVDSHVLRLTFDAGVVSSVKQYNQQDLRDLAFEDRSTPTAGHEYGFVEQLIGNIGKFNRQTDAMQQ